MTLLEAIEYVKKILEYLKIPNTFSGRITLTIELNQGGIRSITKSVEERIK